MNKEQALELAAQAWCTPMTAHLAMQPEIAEAFAVILLKQDTEYVCTCCWVRQKANLEPDDTF